MKKANKIFIIPILAFLSGCAVMEDIIPPAWQSMDAFKKSLTDFGKISSGGDVLEPILVADSIQVPQLISTTEIKVTKNKVTISNEIKINVTSEVTYKYGYEQRSTTQYTPGYEQYHRTTLPRIKQSPENLEFKLIIHNNLQHSLNSADFLAALFINDNKNAANVVNPTKIIPGTSESLIISGAKFSDLKENDKISLRLYDVTTDTNQDGTSSRKENFTWEMAYSSVKEKLREPLFTKTERVLISYQDAQRAKLGYYTSDKQGQNVKRWDPKTDRWYGYKDWKSLGRTESLIHPTGLSALKIGDIQ